MFGLSFGEIFILIVVGIVVVGPRNLPTLMRTAGRWVAKLRRMSTDLRAQSGIDDLIRNEGLERDIHELRSLSRINVVDSLITPALNAGAMGAAADLSGERRPALPPSAAFIRREPLREREYPLIGCDAYEALADDAVPVPPDAVADTMGGPEGGPPKPPRAAERSPEASVAGHDPYAGEAGEQVEAEVKGSIERDSSAEVEPKAGDEARA